MIDPLAKVDPTAEIAAGVEIGPWTYIGPGVTIDEGSVIKSHVVVRGPTSIGKNNKIFQFSSIGEDTPDLKYQGEATQLIIGDNNVIREGVTIHRGTVQDKGKTVIGDNNLLMAYVHIAHDCVVGSNVILVNNASLAGHVVVDDWAILSGYSLVHQFCFVGAHAYAGMASHIARDIPAFMMVYGQPAEVRMINSEGLKRRDFDGEQIKAVKRAFKALYRRGLKLEEATAEIKAMAAQSPHLQELVKSLERTERGILR